ncbi:hypothetical protein N7462_006150 [Penicillium macrosclerotiorum]|uniref:uncharacterized protein n=1 Tax=Penicillium macrosclerotiorum TaxID=303699 RepID=UPI0025474FCE|nr:uncharacterized protein N7462_006150 [Penicillium macrosclerotiorum]KAJ5682985.1 hypothetical protein N7462_006150 [Penicillium macrosclerotiorum]
MAGIGRKAVQGIAAGIGLVSEARPPATEEPPCYEPQEQGIIAREDPEGPAPGFLEEQWALDEIQEELAQSTQEPGPADPRKAAEGDDNAPESADEASLAQRFISTYPAPPPYLPSEELRPLQGRLAAPVVLPQRRPKNRDRGFIRAYAPALDACGINQAMFMDFINTAEKACQASPWLHAINLASIGTIWLPTVTGLAVSIAIQITTDIAIAVEGRRKTNTFFDKVNREFFQPRGLYCLVMTWNPELLDAPATTIDLNSFISKASSRGGSDALSRLRHKYKSSDGKAYGNIFPEVAPLIFPQLDQLAADQDATKKLSKMKKRKEFVASYMDKRAQAKFANENPDSHLSSGPRPTFTSRYADPNHPASSGDPLALVTGGHLSVEKLSGMKARGSRGLLDRQHGGFSSSSSNPPAPHGRPFGLFDAINTVRDLRSSQGGARAALSGSRSPRREIDRVTSRRDDGESGGVRSPLAKLLQKKVLYLAIVNMPSQEEMSRAREALGDL